MSLAVRFDQGVKGISSAWVKKIVSNTLKVEGKAKAWVSVFLTTDKEIRAINKKYLSHDYPTDVISFGLDESPTAAKILNLGDVVVSVQTAKRVSEELGISFREELARYLVHGTLHLLGYEDKSKKDYRQMHSQQEKILKMIFKSR